MRIITANGEASPKIDMRVSYQCENCGHENKYKNTLSASVSKSQEVDSDLINQMEAKRRMIQEAYKEARTQIYNEKNGILSSKNYGWEKCTNCGYIQSWMIESASLGRVGLFSLLPLFVITIGLAAASYFIPYSYPINQILICIVALVIWGITIAIFTNIGNKVSKMYNPNKNFSKPQNTKSPTVVFDELPEEVSVNNVL